MTKRTLAILLMACAAATLAACGGGGGGATDPGNTDDPGNTTPPPSGDADQFTLKSVEWTFALPAKDGALCYDFDTRQEVADCSGGNWDLKVLSDGSSATFWTNGGVSGPGQGAAFGGPFDHTWDELSQWKSATVDPDGGTIPAQAFTKDASSGVFTGTNDIQSAAFEYDLDGANHLFPTYRVFLITTDSSSASAVSAPPAAPVYALQVIGYYDTAGDGASGHPTLRWIDRSTPDDVHTQVYDASTGTVYVNLKDGSTVDKSGDWQVALNRFNVSLNGGSSGTGTVAGFIGRTPDGLYAADGTPNGDAIMAATPASTLQYLTAADMATPAKASDWVSDANHSVLNPQYQGSYPNPLQFGWYNYFPTADAAAAANPPLPAAHMIQARPEGASLIRSGEGGSYARFHLTDIEYDAPADGQQPFNAQQHWTVEFDVQPAAAN